MNRVSYVPPQTACTYQMIFEALNTALQKPPTVKSTGEAGDLDLARNPSRVRRLHGQRAFGQHVVEKGLLIEDDESLPARQKGNGGRIGLVGHHPHELLRKGWLGWLLRLLCDLLGLFGSSRTGNDVAIFLGRNEKLRKSEFGGWTSGSYLLLDENFGRGRRSLLAPSRGWFAGGLRLLGFAGTCSGVVVVIVIVDLHVIKGTRRLEECY